MSETFTIGTRGSKLALWQANWVRAALMETHPALRVDLIVIKTKGDKIQDVPLAKVGGKGLFVKEIEEALLSGRVDAAVHSMKDMPAEIPDGLCIGAVPEREDPGDVLISRTGLRFADLPNGARIGTSSLRRGAQLRHARPDIFIVSLRGNLDTRLKKLDTEGLDAIVLAAAGVKRMGLANRITEHIDEDLMLPAVGQGALCIEIRADDAETHRRVGKLDHPDTRCAVLGERAFLKRLEGGCQVPIGGFARVADGTFSMTGMVAGVDGREMIKETMAGPAAGAERIGRELAERLLESGAKEILEALYGEHGING